MSQVFIIWFIIIGLLATTTFDLYPGILSYNDRINLSLKIIFFIWVTQITIHRYVSWTPFLDTDNTVIQQAIV